MAGFANDRKYCLALYGYMVRWARGRAKSGFVASKTDRAA